MTRGTIFLIEKSKKDKIKITETCEFNGDMYKDGHGKEVMKGLKEVKNLEEFKKFVIQFDQDNFKYQSEPGDYFKFHTHKEPQAWFFYPGERSSKIMHIYFRPESYFHFFFSDWTFWKNLSDIEVLFHTIHPKDEDPKYKLIEGSPMKLLPGECIAIPFGYYERHYR